MTSVRPRLFAAVPLLAVAFVLAPTAAPASLPDSCNGGVDVAVGTPKADVSGQADAGSVTIVFEPDGTSPSLGNTADLVVTEAVLGGTAVAGDMFGAAVVTGYEDANPGCSMVAVGAPGADGGKGKVYVFVLDEDGIVPGSIAVITQDTDGVADTAEAGDSFGASLLFGGDLFVSWLAVGSPGEDIGSAVDAGMVHVLPYTGDASSWGAGSVSYRQGLSPVPGASETGDHFGASIGPGRNVWSLWVGSPEEDLGAHKDAGSVVSLPGSYDSSSGTVKLPGTLGSAAVVVTQDFTGVPGVAEAGDHFGAVLAALAGTQSTDRQPVVGAPGEDIGTARDAGSITVAYQDRKWAAYQQGTGGFSGVAESGDRFGASLSVFGTALLVGAPGEDVGSVADAGLVHFINSVGVVPKLSAGSQQAYHQDSAGVVGTAGSGDQLGASLAFGVDGAVLGVPGEDAGATDAGSLAFLPYAHGAVTMGLTTTGNALYAVGDAGFPGAPEAGAAFGAVAYSVSQ